MIWLILVLIEAQRKKIDFFLKSSFRSNKPRTKNFFAKISLKRTLKLLIENSYFIVGNVFLIQTIPMGIDSGPFRANLYLCNYESKDITNLMRTNKLRGTQLHSSFWLIDDLSAFNNGGQFSKAFPNISYRTKTKS